MAKLVGPFGPFRDRLKAFTRGARDLDEGGVEALHHTRVASRRLREILPVLGLEGDTAARLGRRLKKVTRQLGTVRELDVLRLTVQELGQDPRVSPTALKHVRAAVETDRVAARDRLADKLPLEKIQRLAHGLERAAEHSASDEKKNDQRGRLRSRRAWVWALEARVARRAARVRSAIESAGALYVPERLHEVRLALKKLRYAMELAAEAQSQRASRDITVVRAAQDLLGRLHDLELLIARVRGEQASHPPALATWRELDSLVRTLEDDCRALHARYMHDRARLIAIADRVFDTKEHAAAVSRRAAV